MIQVLHAVKQYTKNDAPAINDVSVDFAPGHIYGLLGRNGAGKTTLVNLITNRLFLSGGEVTIDGEAAAENTFAQEKIFCMTEKGAYYSELRVMEALAFTQSFYPEFDREYAETLLKRFDVDCKKRIRMLSTGYGSIVKMIFTLASGAPYMIFDEPTLGLDATARDMFYRELLARFSALNNTMILSTHLIVEIEELIDHVIILHGGRVLVDVDAEALRTRAYTVSGAQDQVEACIAGKKILSRQALGGYLAATVDEPLNENTRKTIKAAGLDVSGAKLQDIFIKLTTNKENEREK